MSASFAAGRIAVGLCDRCGWQYLLRELTDQTVGRKKTGLLVCGPCLDEDHPQYRLGETPVFDPQALRDPRPDKRTDVSNNPVFSGTYTPSGAPIFTNSITPLVGTLASTGIAPTVA